ncbi:MAG: large protein [Chitinophagaceae bacterium]|nr:large protein [Chitinophagaceae bacterium]
MTTRKLIFTLFLISCFFNCFAQPGTLDASFNSTGINTFSFKQNTSAEHVAGSAADTLGNIYITGSETTTFTIPFVIKVLPNGKLDRTFGTNGKVTLDFLEPNSFVPAAIVIHPDGGIVLAGYHTSSSLELPCIVKLLPNGSLDPSFNYTGTGYTDFPSSYAASGSGATFTAVHVSSTDIIASGSTAGVGNAGSNFLVVRVNGTNGTPLDGWGNGNGEQPIDFGATPDYSTCSALLGNILYMAGSTGTSNDMAIAAIDVTSGSLSTSYAAGFGYETLPLIGGTSLNSCNAIQVASDGSVVLGGYATDGSGNNNFMIYQLLSDGSFGYSQMYTIGSSTDSKAYSLSLDEPNNGLLIGGSIKNPVSGIYSWTLIRTNYATGAQDNIFGVQNYTSVTSSAFDGIADIIHLKDNNYILGGSIRYPITGTTDIKVKKVDPSGVAVAAYGSASEGTFWVIDQSSYVTDMAKRSDGKLWVCGNYKDASSGIEIPVIALMNPDGSFDTGFGGTSGADAGVLELHNIAPSTIVNGIRVGSFALQGSDLIVAGTYLDTNLFVIRVKSDGTLDNSFNGNLKFNDLPGPNGKGAYAHQVLVQPDNKILVYGYLGGSLVIGRYNSDGTQDAGFGGGTGYYVQDSTDIGDYDVLGVQLALQADGKIVAVGTHVTPFTSSEDLLVFRLNTNGTRDYTFASSTLGLFTYNTTGPNGVQSATSVCINSKGKIIVGGLVQTSGSPVARTEQTASSTYNYLLLQVNPNGTLDTTFALHGAASINAGYSVQGILGLQLENDNAIVATGVATDINNKDYATALRFNASGSLDNTFNGQGHYAISRGYPKKALILGGSLYVLGGDDKLDNSPYGYIAKLKLGSGPVIKTTYLALPNYINKYYGDKPFQVKPVTNSPAPIQYSVSGSGCATIDAATGLVTMTCATINPPVTIMVVQPAISGYTADTAYTYLNIQRGTPTIVFDEQGGIIGEKFQLAFQTNYNDPTLTYYTQLNPYYSPYLSLYNNDSIEVLAEGTASVTIYFSGTNNFEAANVTAIIHGYTQLVAPVASDDAAVLTSGLDNDAVIQVLANDQAFSGQIQKQSIDLDPSTPLIIDTVYVSPSLGLFFTDTTGAVHYVHFVGFIGSGSINYTIRDNHNQVSAAAKISVAVQVQGEKPALKATELFTPNNDGLNDAFVIGFVDLEKTNILKIYDRNGEELFTFSDYKNDWAGDMPNGNKAENGIYYYLFTEGADGGDQRELKGVVELRR